MSTQTENTVKATKAPKALVSKKTESKKETKAIKAPVLLTFSAPIYTPTSGKALWTLTHAVLELNHQFTKRGWIPKGNIANFYSTSTVVRHHLKNGNFEENEKGFIRLSVTGLNYFKARINGMNKAQRITQKEVDDLMKVLKAGPVKNQTRECKIMSI